MKKIVYLFAFVFMGVSCKTNLKPEELKENEIIKQKVKDNFPEEMSMIFARHGGIEVWRNAKTLSFNKGEEVHTSNLKTRKISINAPTYILGFDGKETWLKENEKGTFKGNKDFYYNLYFYFYAMPFVLADQGITYTKTNALAFDGKKYPGIKISYAKNIGTSPDDNYIIYYNPENYQMEWLAYTVTFKNKKPSDNYNLIRYNNWEKVNDLLLPKSITWYTKGENGEALAPVGESVEFTLPLLSKTQLQDTFFEKPE